MVETIKPFCTSCIALAVAIGLAPIDALGQEAGADSWRVTIAPYVWMAALKGDLGLGPVDADVDVSFSDILENLNMAGMILAEFQKGPWIVAVNYVGLQVEADPRERLEFTNNANILGFGIGYQIVDHEIGRGPAGERLAARFSPVVGGRYTYISAEVAIDDIGPINGRQFQQSESWVDPVVGFRGSVDLTDRWRLAGEADIGGFSVGSDFAWNALAVVTYRTSFFGVPTDLVAGYRGLGQDYDDGGFKYDIVTHGPIIGAAFHF